jgi:hypothetical protein
MTDQLYNIESFPEDALKEHIPDPSDEELILFKQQVAEWIKIDDQVRKLSIAIRERRVHQKTLSKKVQEFMIKNGYNNLNTQQGVIKSNVRDVKQPLKLNEIRIKIEELDESETLTKEQIIQRFFEIEREITQKQSLRRQIPKVSMNLDL